MTLAMFGLAQRSTCKKSSLVKKFYFIVLKMFHVFIFVPSLWDVLLGFRGASTLKYNKIHPNFGLY